ncbi:MAG: hypothetical protein LC650_02340 [Actinobacteria bacterium]|nr:hypothetical protein [Actinomycetota bacterium]
MGLITTMLMIGVPSVVAFWGLALWFARASYKYPCEVAIPVGESPDDIVWARDKFKTREKKGHTEISFLRHRGKVYSPPYKFWSKWVKKGKTVPEEERDWAKLSDPDLRKHLLRGAHFYKVGDNDYKVMKVNALGDFTVLDHDSTELIIDDIERQNEVTTSFKDKLLQLGLWLGSLLIISLLAITIIVLSFKYSGDQSAAIVAAAKSVAAAQPGVGA